jgi:hypothetical protein
MMSGQFSNYVSDGAAPGAAAIANVGGPRVQIIRGSVAVGWIGSAWWTNWPQFQQYQLSIVTSPDDSGGTAFTCCARPRWSHAQIGASRSQRLAESLVSEVRRLTNGT